MNPSSCVLCQDSSALWWNEKFRVVLVEEQPPGFTRLIWQQHQREMSDLASADRALIYEVVNSIEQTMRTVLAPDKINLASLGNKVAHVHWHIIPRWHWDAHFPLSVWSAEQRVVAVDELAQKQKQIATYQQALLQALSIYR